MPVCAKSPQRTSTRCKIAESALNVSSSQILGFVYFPYGTLNFPLEFTRYSPLKQVRLRKINNAAVLTSELFFSLKTFRFSDTFPP